jgi:hypothetical protein
MHEFAAIEFWNSTGLATRRPPSCSSLSIDRRGRSLPSSEHRRTALKTDVELWLERGH